MAYRSTSLVEVSMDCVVDNHGMQYTAGGHAVLWLAPMEITELLHRVHSGDQEALHTVIPMVYGELKKLAAGHLRREGRVRPLETTALVHEAFLRLVHGQQPSYENRA